MSTIVPMPVRAKPLLADRGETISPGCAALTVTMPLNGARMTVSSWFRSATSKPGARNVDRACLDGEVSPGCVVGGAGRVKSLAADQAGERAAARCVG